MGRKLAMILLISMSMVGCKDSTADRAIEQGKLAMANKEYDKAKASFELALNEGSKQEDLKVIIKIINDYDEVKEDLLLGNLEEARIGIEEIDESYIEYSIKDDIDNLDIEIKSAEEEKKKQEELAKAEEEKRKQEELAKAEEEKRKQEELAKVEEEKRKQEELEKSKEYEHTEPTQEQIEQDYEEGNNWLHGGGVKADGYDDIDDEPTQEQIEEDYEEGNNWLHGGGVKADDYE